MNNWLQKIAMLFVEGQGDTVVAYKGGIFLIDRFNDDLDSPVIQKMSNYFGVDIHYTVSDVHDYLSYLEDLRPDILQGTIRDDGQTLLLRSKDFQHSTGSKLLKNVLNTLGIKYVEYENEYGTYNAFSNWQITGDLPEFLFHGTTSQYAGQIVRFGLMPDQTNSNYPGHGPHESITHEEYVFLTEDLNSASYHAMNAVEINGGFPVIFRFKIPDPNLLVQDYDIEIMSNESSNDVYVNTYKAPRDEYQPKIQESPFGFSKKVGLFGYHGRIPSNFIIDILIQQNENDKLESDYSDESWTSVTVDQLIRAVEVGDPFYIHDYSEDYDEYEEEDEF
ncbi:MAG: hypothetical protein FK734_13335 [Asgard group archaeon]|nr:hypothetical protein [Asgard group archaeon]